MATPTFRDGYDTAPTWECHVCFQERPDDKISVHRRPLRRGRDASFSRTITENIRYCNDNPECFRAAKSFSFVKGFRNAD